MRKKTPVVASLAVVAALALSACSPQGDNSPAKEKAEVEKTQAAEDDKAADGEELVKNKPNAFTDDQEEESAEPGGTVDPASLTSTEDVCTAVSEDLSEFESDFIELAFAAESVEEGQEMILVGELMQRMGEESSVVELTANAENKNLAEDAKDFEALFTVGGMALIKGIEDVNDIELLAELQDEVDEDMFTRLTVLGIQYPDGDAVEHLFEDCRDAGIEVFPLMGL